jgi:glycosyltransferase involved in cell wall biosynthesis
MKIALLSKADASGGGASRVAEELARLLNASGHTAHHYVARKQPDNPAVRSLYGSFTWGRPLRRLHHLVKRAGFPELIPWELLPLYFQQIQHYDLLHFHDLSSAISPLTVKYLACRHPTVWTFHDCSPFTGGCLYPMECNQYQTRCNHCPQLGQWPIDVKFDFTGFMQDIKRKTAQENNFIAATPSQWMAKMAVSSGMYISSPLVVPNGVDTGVFYPFDKKSIRAKLNLPLHRPIILMVAAYLWEERKGVSYALEALARIKHLKPYILLVGHVDEKIKRSLSDYDYFSTGYIPDERLKATYFVAADVFLSCSLAESFSLVTVETMATATPSVSFSTGAITELIEHNHTGYLVPPTDVDGLVTGLTLALTSNRAAEWGRNARRRAETLYSHEVFLKNHLNLYEQVIGNFKSS